MEMNSHFIEYILGSVIIIEGIICSPFLFAGLYVLSDKLSKKINSQGELDEAVKKEANELCLEGVIIDSKFKSDFQSTPYARLLGPRHWEIGIGNDKNSRKHSSLRHELYHIKRHEKDHARFPGSLFDWQYIKHEESRAIMYGLFGVQL